MKILIETIPHSAQRYPTVGDWYVDYLSDTLHIKVSRMEDRRHIYLIAIHELTEAFLCMHRGITSEQIDQWDLTLTAEGNFDPGDHPDAPYHQEHTFATAIERILASALEVRWNLYSDYVEALF